MVPDLISNLFTSHVFTSHVQVYGNLHV